MKVSPLQWPQNEHPRTATETHTHTERKSLTDAAKRFTPTSVVDVSNNSNAESVVYTAMVPYDFSQFLRLISRSVR